MRRARGRSERATWSTYRDSIGDRSELFAELQRGWTVRTALYPGSYLDLAPSTAFASVTYVDNDRRADRFFGDTALVTAQLNDRRLPGAGQDVAFLHRDYTQPLPLPAAGFDLLISLYAGPVWEHCRQHLAHGGLFLANTSHGDASIAALDPELRLVAAVQHRDGRYRFDTDGLERYLVPKKPAEADAARVRDHGRGIAYTRTAFAYLFELSATNAEVRRVPRARSIETR